VLPIPTSRWSRRRSGSGNRGRRKAAKIAAAGVALTLGVLGTAQLAGAHSLSSDDNKHHGAGHHKKLQKTRDEKQKEQKPSKSGSGGNSDASTGAYSSTPAASTSVTSAGMGTGDTRHIIEPTVPSRICAALTANLVGTSLPTAAPDTSRIQRALDSCQTSSGQVAVELKAQGGYNAFLSGALKIHKGEVLLVDSNVTLYGSLNPADYQVPGGPTCGTLDSTGEGCNPLIDVPGDAVNAGVEGVRAADGSQGRIDGQGGQTMSGKSETWWQLARDAGKANKKQNVPRTLVAQGDNFTLYHIDLLNSPKFHVTFKNANGMTAWGVRILTPSNARNTDGIDPSGSSNVTINDSYISTGDDCIAIKAAAPSKNITVENTHCYGTHGLSIGSETNGGLTNVLFQNDTLDGIGATGIPSTLDSGLRIKSSGKNGGKVANVTYNTICLRNVQQPLVFDTHYADGGSGSNIPYYTGITVSNVTATHSPSGASSVFDGYDAAHPLGVTLNNVTLDATASTAQYAKITTSNSNISPAGTDVTVFASSGGAGSGDSCSFPAFPGL